MAVTRLWHYGPKQGAVPAVYGWVVVLVCEHYATKPYYGSTHSTALHSITA